MFSGEHLDTHTHFVNDMKLKLLRVQLGLMEVSDGRFWFLVTEVSVTSVVHRLLPFKKVEAANLSSLTLVNDFIIQIIGRLTH